MENQNKLKKQNITIVQEHRLSDSTLKEKSSINEEKMDRNSLMMIESINPFSADEDVPTLTFRFWILATLFNILLSSVNQVFFFREVKLHLGSFVLVFFIYPLGILMEKTLPTKSVYLWGYKFSLNPGKFNRKEHSLIVIASSAASGTTQVMDIILSKRLFFKGQYSTIGAVLLLLSSQLLGYGFSGLFQSSLVKPKKMIWPDNLVSVKAFDIMHLKSQKSIRNFFLLLCISVFFYSFIPSYLFTTIASISILCFVYPNDVIAQQLGSGWKGLGMGSFSLDWANISGHGSPFVTPFWSQLNTMGGFIFGTWVLTPLIYYLNLFDAMKFPIFSNQLFDNEGKEYDTDRIMKDEKFQQDLYEGYSPLRMSTSYVLMYFVGFMLLSSLFTHTFLYHGKQIWERITNLKNPIQADDDMHSVIMRKFEGIPDLWYLLTFVISFSMGVASLYLLNLDLPIWGFILAIFVSFIFILPVGIIVAVSNHKINFNVLTEFIAGYLFTGSPLANITFKVFGQITMSHSLQFIKDLKLGYYMKIPPRHMFISQCYGSVIAVFSNLLVADFMIKNVNNICTEAAKPWTCPSLKNFYNHGIVWGLIGPQKMFGAGSEYNILLYGFLIGAVLPIPFYYLAKRYPDSALRFIHIPIIISALAIHPPSRAAGFVSWCIIGLVSNLYFRKYHEPTYKKYYLMLSGGLETGVAFAGIAVFLCFQIPNLKLHWWGNNKEYFCPLAEEPLL